MGGPVKKRAWLSRETPRWQGQLSKCLVHSSGWASCWNQCSAPRRVTGPCSCQPPSITCCPSYGQCQAELRKTRSWRGLSPQPCRGLCGCSTLCCQQLPQWCCRQVQSLKMRGFGWSIEKKEWEKEREKQKFIPTQCILWFYDFVCLSRHICTFRKSHSQEMKMWRVNWKKNKTM